MKSMIGRLEEYLDRKKLELNPKKKTKIMRFRRREGRMKRKKWEWKGETMEEVKNFVYLGLQRNGGQEEHVRERMRKAAVMR